VLKASAAAEMVRESNFLRVLLEKGPMSITEKRNLKRNLKRIQAIKLLPGKLMDPLLLRTQLR
jgi:hypothetical protein